MTYLMTRESNGHGRSLCQIGNVLYVLTGCCKARIDSNYMHKGDDHVWAQCLGCSKLLQTNDHSWDSVIHDLDMEVTLRTSPESWAPWGEYWFGLKDFAMDIRESK